MDPGNEAIPRCSLNVDSTDKHVAPTSECVVTVWMKTRSNQVISAKVVFDCLAIFSYSQNFRMQKSTVILKFSYRQFLAFPVLFGKKWEMLL